MVTTNSMEVTYQASKTTDEGTGCYVLLAKEAQEGTVTQTVGTTPITDTFSFADEAGVYKSTVYFTAISKQVKVRPKTKFSKDKVVQKISE